MKKGCIVMLAVLFGCQGKQGPQGPAGTEKMQITGVIDDNGTVSVWVGDSPVIPSVSVNDKNIDLDGTEGIWNWYEGDVSVSAGDTAYLKVDNTNGVATALVRIPGSFGITSPDTSDIYYIPVNSNLTVNWSASNHANFYHIYFYLHYSYYDTSDTYRDFSFDKDTSVTSNSITFSASRLFPADFDSISSYSYGYFDIYAYNGPKLEVGSQGNVTGDGIGFFHGTENGGRLYIRIEGTKGRAGSRVSREELRKKWLEKAKSILNNDISIPNTAVGDENTASGSENTAVGNQNTAVGDENTASGSENTAVGDENTASGSENTAVGN